MWINRHKLNNSLVVFVHGLWGERYLTWRKDIDDLQEECSDDPLIRSYDMYLFGYDSGYVRNQPALAPWVLADLQRFLGSRRSREKYKTTVLIGHSQGGILAKLYVLSQLREGKGESLTVDLIVTFGTPHHGFITLNVNPLFGLQKVAGDWIPFRQWNDLAAWSANIKNLRQHWREGYISCDPCPATANQRHIRSLAVAGAYDRLVGKNSAFGFSPVDLRDFSMLKHTGSGNSGARAKAIIEKLQEHQDPEKLVKLIKAIRADSSRRADYCRKNRDLVVEEVRVARPGWEEEMIECKANSILFDFLYEFQERPLRGLNLEESLTVYAHRLMGDQV